MFPACFGALAIVWTSGGREARRNPIEHPTKFDLALNLDHREGAWA